MSRSPLNAHPWPVDVGGMQLNSQKDPRPVAIAAFRGKHFAGYAVRTEDIWTAVGSMDMSWLKSECPTLNDARVWLRTTSQAARFDTYTDFNDLRDAIDRLQIYAKPAIELESVIGADAFSSQKIHPPAMSRLG